MFKKHLEEFFITVVNTSRQDVIRVVFRQGELHVAQPIAYYIPIHAHLACCGYLSNIAVPLGRTSRQPMPETRPEGCEASMKPDTDTPLSRNLSMRFVPT